MNGGFWSPKVGMTLRGKTSSLWNSSESLMMTPPAWAVTAPSPLSVAAISRRDILRPRAHWGRKEPDGPEGWSRDRRDVGGHVL
jgi:hypothetical protein